MKSVPHFPRVDWTQPLEHKKGAKGNDVQYFGVQDAWKGKKIKNGCVHFVVVAQTPCLYDDYGCTETGYRMIWNVGMKDAPNPELAEPRLTPTQQRDNRLVRAEERIRELEDSVKTFTSTVRELKNTVNALTALVTDPNQPGSLPNGSGVAEPQQLSA